MTVYEVYYFVSIINDYYILLLGTFNHMFLSFSFKNGKKVLR